MTYKVGVVPAAGKADRFGGIYKELLPLPRGGTLLEHCVRSMKTAGADVVMVVSRQEKIAAHTDVLRDHVKYAVQSRFDKDFWQAIIQGLHIKADRYYFAMPDTFFPEDIFLKMTDAPFQLGTHITDTPERYGVIVKDQVINKRPSVGGAVAWGVLSWNMEVAAFWLKNLKTIRTYTEAINAAMRYFDWESVPMEYYYDMAEWSEYAEFVGLQR